MNEQVTIQVSPRIRQMAARVAARNHQTIEQVLSARLEATWIEAPVEALSDEEVMVLAEQKFTPEEQERFSDLLYENREGLLTTERRAELRQMMRAYESGLLRKAQALEEAVRRGLRPPLTP